MGKGELMESLLFQETDPDYAEFLLAAAKNLFDFADLYRDDYQNSIPNVNDFYRYVWNGARTLI